MYKFLGLKNWSSDVKGHSAMKDHAFRLIAGLITHSKVTVLDNRHLYKMLVLKTGTNDFGVT